MTNLKLGKLWSLEGLLLGAIALGVILRIINLGTREFWYDEVLSLLLVTGQKSVYQTPQDSILLLSDYKSLFSIPLETGLTDMLKTIVSVLRGIVAEPHPPLFFLGQHLWLRCFGNSEAAMRSLEVLYSIGAIFGAFGLGRCLLGYRGGLLLAATLAVNDYYLFHSLNVRMYAAVVFWGVLSAWSLLELIQDQKHKILWIVLLIGSITAGLMNFYLFAYYIIALALLTIYLDAKRWWQYGLYLTIGVIITFPWVWWGMRQQLRNADFGRFGSKLEFLPTMGRHLQDILQNLGTYLIVGDWASNITPIVTTIAGAIALLALIGIIINLWGKQEQKLLIIGLILGISPLVIALTLDIVKNQFTLGFGFARSLIVILPGCLLLITIFLEKLNHKWQKPLIITFLLFSLTITISDYSLRSRSIFHQLTNLIQEQPNTPTLIAINSRAWGHILRLAYYLPENEPLSLLAQDGKELPSALVKNLDSTSQAYPRLIWLNSANPVWNRPKNEEQRQQWQQETEKVLNARYQLTKTQQLTGTMNLDQFTVYIYNKRT